MEVGVMDLERDLALWPFLVFPSKPWRVVVKRTLWWCVRARPLWTLTCLGRWSRAVGVLWNLACEAADMPEQLSHVYDGIFWLM